MAPHDGYDPEEEAGPEDPRPTDELIRVALEEEDEEAAWDAVEALHRRGDRDVLENARKLLEARDAPERRLGANILGQLGVPERTFPGESVTLLLSRLEREPDPGVLSAIGIALGHLEDPRAVKPLAALKDHPDAEVRYGVVFGLLGHEEEEAVRTLIELSRDEDADVRNWATFGLGSQLEADGPEIRRALAERILDEDDETRGEALLGLALRGDPDVMEPLMREISEGAASEPAVAAAGEIGDPDFYPALRKLKVRWQVEGEPTEQAMRILDEAIESCRPG